MQKQTLDVQGMSCGHCKSAVEGALKDLGGISDVHVDLDSGKVDVMFDDQSVTVDEMRDAVEEQGYDVV
ncbi:MAG TPA: copper chaperone CopZ [Virgibacillus sp.]|nr:copper chaperone CopZ [Virgibacillus sp.]